MSKHIAHAPESNAAGVQGALPSEQLGLAEKPMQASLGTCCGCSEEKPLITCRNCSCLTCSKCCRECNSRTDNNA